MRSSPFFRGFSGDQGQGQPHEAEVPSAGSSGSPRVAKTEIAAKDDEVEVASDEHERYKKPALTTSWPELSSDKRVRKPDPVSTQPVVVIRPTEERPRDTDVSKQESPRDTDVSEPVRPRNRNVSALLKSQGTMAIDMAMGPLESMADIPERLGS